MRLWRSSPAPAATAVLSDLVGDLGLSAFPGRLLERIRALVPAGSCSVYRTGARPALFMSGSVGMPDTTRDCWRAYLSGPHRADRSLLPAQQTPLADSDPLVCHITAREVDPEHRARVYEAHGMVERISVLQAQADASVFAVNFYRHAHERPFSDAQLEDFAGVAPVLLALTRKHLALSGGAMDASYGSAAVLRPSSRQVLALRCPALTERELDVCERLLRGMTHDGVAADLGLSLPTVKTYRNRAFARLGIHFRSELSALLI
jgi:DNA-binding CsgD family transcriptional regulator